MIDFVKRVVPAIATARRYSLGELRSDVLAGLSVSVVAVPQSMAFAIIAGVAPIYGLYTLIVQCFVGAIFSSSQHLSIGPTNTLSLLVASVAVQITGPDAPEATYLSMVIGLTLLSGLLQIGFAVARVGNLVRYVSHSVIVGFTAGAGILIIVKQIPVFLGVPLATAEHHLPGLPGTVVRMWPNIGQVNEKALLVGVASLAVMLIARRISKRMPAALMALATGTVMVVVMGWQDGDLDLIGELPRSLVFVWPHVSWGQINDVLVGAVAIALVGVLEAVAIGKSVSAKSEQIISPNQEILGQGVTNFVSSFFGCFPGTGSFSRTALNYMAGAQTRFAGMFNSVFVATFVLLFAEMGRYIPPASLAAILFVVAYGLIDWRFFLRVGKTGRSDLSVCTITMLATLFTHLEYAIFLGIFLNIALYLRRASRLKIAEMVDETGKGRYQERPIHDRHGQKRVIFLQMEGDLFFGVADELQDRLTGIINNGARIVIFRLKRTHWVDSTVLGVFETFTKQLKTRGGHVILCGVRPELMKVLRNYGLVFQIGSDNVFETSEGIFTSAKLALKRAQDLAGDSIDTEGIDEADEMAYWTYVI